MITPAQAVVLLAAASGVIAAPATKQSSNASVAQVKNPHFKGHNGYILAHKSFKKYNKPIPAGLQEKVDRIHVQRKIQEKARGGSSGGGGTASAGTSSSGDEEWLTPVTVGSKKLNLDFDTGSSDLWIPKSDYDNKGTAMSGASWSIQYGDGSSASGKVYTETVTIGGKAVTGQAVEVASTSSGDFGDGLLGLGFNTINTVEVNSRPKPQNTWFDNACKQGLTSCLFTADLGSGDSPGSYNFGYVDSSYGSINYVNIDNSNGWYQFDVSAASSSSRGGSASVIADTGTTLLMLPQTITDAYWKQVKGAKYNSREGVYTGFSCSATLPDFQLKIGSKTVNIPGEFMAFDDGEDGCIGGMTAGCDGTDDPSGVCILGDVFLKAVYAVFDKAGNRFGWAQKV